MSTTKSIEIVSHCWGGDLPIYPHLLRAQGLSLLHHSLHRCEVTWTICFHESDYSVVGVIDELADVLTSRNVMLRQIVLSKGSLFERAIGRNEAAITSREDCVWFCDCDYLFSGNCLDSAIEATALYPDTIVYPSTVLVTSHDDGDLIISQMQDKQALTSGDLSRFFLRPETKAIGGIQIVSGDLARSRGYLNKTKWMRPRQDTSRGKFSTASDVRFRSCIGKTGGMLIPGVHRIRHSRRSYGGTVID